MLLAARYHARSSEVHAYLLECSGGEIKPEDLSAELEDQAGSGNLPMVRYLLDMGVPMTTPRGYNGSTSALVEACYRCHEDVVDLLLERGADPNFGYEKPVGVEVDLTPLIIAAAAGSLTIVQKLLDHGARMDVPADEYMTRLPALWWAIAIGHTAMVQLLLERGASLVGRKIEAALEIAEELDLDSMAEILRGLGVRINLSLKDVGPWLAWSAYPRPIG
jgi:ankyrin repeat protein